MSELRTPNSELILTEVYFTNSRTAIHLYHDILDAFEDEFCKQIKLLSIRKSVIIDIENIELEFIPIENKDEVTCHVRFIGIGKSRSYTLCLSQVIEKMSQFINKILKTAVRRNYINSEDLSKIVEWHQDYLVDLYT